MKYRKFAWLFGALGLVACESSRMVSGPTMGPPPGSLDPKGPLWLQSGGNSLAISRVFYDAAGIAGYPSAVCWLGDFNNWAMDCRVQSEYDPATKSWPFPVAAAQNAGVNIGVYNHCSRLSFYNKSNSGDWLKVNEFINSQGGFDKLTAEQQRSLGLENGQYLPRAQFVQGTRLQLCT